MIHSQNVHKLGYLRFRDVLSQDQTGSSFLKLLEQEIYKIRNLQDVEHTLKSLS